MSASTFPWLLAAGTAIAGFLLGAVLLRRSARSGSGVPTSSAAHRIRSLEAELRVAQRGLADLRTERDALADEAARLRQELDGRGMVADKRDDQIRKLKSELQHELAKTARLRQELADRAEEMIRTHVQLRDAENELGVSRLGSDVIVEQLKRFEQEREDLSGLVATLKRELDLRKQQGDQARPAATDRGPVFDC